MGNLALKDVAYQYEGARKSVFRKVNIEFEMGKVYTVVGKSGAGKSTLLSLLAGLDVCSEGEVSYGGESLKELDRDNYRAKNVGVIFQSYNLINYMMMQAPFLHNGKTPCLVLQKLFCEKQKGLDYCIDT